MDNNEKNDDGYSNKKYMKYKTSYGVFLARCLVERYFGPVHTETFSCVFVLFQVMSWLFSIPLRTVNNTKTQENVSVCTGPFFFYIFHRILPVDNYFIDFHRFILLADKTNAHNT